MSDEDYDDEAEWDAASRRRVRIPLDGGHMDVCLRDDASPETVAALTALGQAAVARMKSDDAPAPRRDIQTYGA